MRAATRLAEWLADFPLLADAYAAGDLTQPHLHLLRTKIDNPRTHRHLLGDQQLFVDAGRDCSFRDFKRVAEYWLVRIDVDGEEPQDQQDKRAVRFATRPGGRVMITGDLDALSGQAVQTAIEAEVENLRRQDLADDVDRTIAQRRAAALVNLVTRGAARPDGTTAKPLINIVMSQAVFEWLIANTANDDAGGEVQPRLNRRSREPCPVATLTR